MYQTIQKIRFSIGRYNSGVRAKGRSMLRECHSNSLSCVAISYSLHPPSSYSREGIFQGGFYVAGFIRISIIVAVSLDKAHRGI